MKDIHMPTWKTPDSYMGFDPVGDYCLYMKTRDSEIMTESNFACIKKDMEQFIEKGDFPDPNAILDEYGEERPSDWFYTWSAGHWACGWVEYMMVRKDAPEEIIEKADEIYCAISDYPIYDENDYSERQDEAMWNYWKSMSMRERIQYCKEAMESIFAARRDDCIPEGVIDHFDQYGTFA